MSNNIDFQWHSLISCLCLGDYLMYIFNKKQINQNNSELNISDLFNKFDQISSNLQCAEEFSHENLSFV